MSSVSRRRFEPHPYQRGGIDWLLTHTYSGLFLPPGLGKTAVVLAAFRRLRALNLIDRMLVIAPLRVASIVWPGEAKKWFDDVSVVVLHGADKDSLAGQDSDIYAVNPEGLLWLTNKRGFFSNHKWMLVCDESTVFKNPKSKRFKLLRKQLGLFTRRVILTGTPAPNGLEQLWSQMYVVDGGQRLYPKNSQFREAFYRPAGFSFGGYGQVYKLTETGEREIYARIGDAVLHKSNDELDLPPVSYNTIQVELPPAAQAAYRAMKRDFVALEGIVVANNAAAKCLKLKQLANGNVYTESGSALAVHREKVAAVREMHGHLAGRPLLVVYEFSHDLAQLRLEFPGTPCIGGKMRPGDTARIVAGWNSGGIPLLFLNPRAGGHGLNLQGGGCHDIVWFSIPFDLELYIQANARVHRQGVRNPVTVHHIVARNTVDGAIMNVLHGKAKLQDALLNYLKG